MNADLRDEIRRKARELGFDAIGFCAAEADPMDARALAAFVKKGWHGDMTWMARGPAWAKPGENPRGDPKALMPAARSVIVLGTNYGPAHDPLAVLSQKDRGGVSVYARAAKDYHDVVKKRLKRLGRWLAERHTPSEVKVFVDTAPLMEKPLAARAGIGWQGKHTNLVSRRFGSWLFLGEILTSLEIPPDLPEPDHCGNCRACMDACPTQAIPEPYRLDATRCVSYLTIEHKGAIAPELMAAMGNRIYGCDDCLAVCPWNKFAAPTAEPALRPRPDLAAPALAELAGLDDLGFRAKFAGSPIKRTGRERFVRNVLIAIGNGDDAGMRPLAERLAGDPEPLVRDAARWALQRLGPPDAALDDAGGRDNHSATPVTNGERNSTP